jgi:DMSO/TMAO reductase YedYZ molybdopterin-dependent catalytic subunit
VTADQHLPRPPGQILTRKFPIVGEKEPAPEALDLAGWRLTVGGWVARAIELTYDELLAFPQRELTADIHCVTGWTHLGLRFTGLPLSELLAEAVPLPAARFVHFGAHSPREHDTSLPLELALADTWLVHAVNGEPLTPAHGFPLRTVTPSRYFYKSLKWVRAIELLAEDRLGFWERESAYHNNADPWPGNERYVFGSHSAEEIAAFRDAASYVPYRGPKRLLLGVDLSGWAPKTKDLGDLHLKSCNLAGAQLAGVNLAGANLTRSSFAGASLAGADLRGADLEGADFASADLTGADLSGAALSAARFVGAKVDGLCWDGATGLLEAEEAYLAAQTAGGISPSSE